VSRVDSPFSKNSINIRLRIPQIYDLQGYIPHLDVAIITILGLLGLMLGPNEEYIYLQCIWAHQDEDGMPLSRYSPISPADPQDR
jgi:hypothetical protein